MPFLIAERGSAGDEIPSRQTRSQLSFYGFMSLSWRGTLALTYASVTEE